MQLLSGSVSHVSRMQRPLRPPWLLELTRRPGATTYRVKANGLVIFLDTWLERPSVLPKVLAIEDVTEADYIFISHAHFDQ